MVSNNYYWAKVTDFNFELSFLYPKITLMKMLDNEIISRRIGKVKFFGGAKASRSVMLSSELKDINVGLDELVLITLRNDKVIEIKALPKEMINIEAQDETCTPIAKEDTTDFVPVEE
jgi:hypothetical protein